MASPSPKRTKLDSPAQIAEDDDEPEEEVEGDHCAICLQPFLDRTILPACAHEFCFDCVLSWSDQSRKCPLCSRSFDGSYLIHRVRSQHDYQKHYLPPLPSSSPSAPLTNALRRARRERQWGRRQRRERQEADELERAIARRRWVYRHHLYAKHVASNPHTRYRPFPTPAQFAASPDLVSRMTTFLRRELRVWPDLDVEFLTTYTVALMKSIDVRSEAAVRLLAEFLDLDAPRVHAEHFAHEIYSYLRSPYRDLDAYDRTVQYDVPPETSPPPRDETRRGRRRASSSSRRSDGRDATPARERSSSGRDAGAEDDASDDGLARSRPRGRDEGRGPFDDARDARGDEGDGRPRAEGTRVSSGDDADGSPAEALVRRSGVRRVRVGGGGRHRTLSESVLAHLNLAREVG